MLATKLGFENRRDRCEAMAGACELTQHRVVLELTEHEWAHALTIEPLIQGAAYRSVVRGQKHRHAVQGLRKSPAQGLGKRWDRHPVHIAAAECMAVRTNVERRSDRRIGQDDVDLVHSEICD